MSDDVGAACPECEEVVEETINAYRVQKLANGQVRIVSGGLTITAHTYWDALEDYGAFQRKIAYESTRSESSEALRERMTSIHDGWIPLYSMDSSGFTPEEILDAVVAQPLDVILDDLDQEGSA